MGLRPRSTELVAQLRTEMAQLEGRGAARATLPFGVPAIDRRLPGHGLVLGALHEVQGGGFGADHAAAATLFIAGILARLKGPVLWCLKSRDLFAPALAAVGLQPDRIIYAETGREADILPVMEEGLRHPALAAVVGEVGKLQLTPSRRLQLAAEHSEVLALMLHRPRAAGNGDVTAAVTRWRVTALPSAPLAVPGIGRARWRVELLRCRGAEAASWNLEACDAKGRLSVSAELGHGPAAQATRRTG